MAARVVQGFAVGAATGTVTAMILDFAPGPRLGSMVSSAVPSLGIAGGSVLAGALVQLAPDPRQLVFWILGVLYVVLAAAIWLVPEQPRHESNAQGSVWRALLPSVLLPATTRPTFFALVPSVSATWALAGLYLSLGSSVRGSVLHVHSDVVVGVVLGAFFAAGAAGTVASAALAAHLRERFAYAALTVGVLVTVVAMPMHALPL